MQDQSDDVMLYQLGGFRAVVAVPRASALDVHSEVSTAALAPSQQCLLLSAPVLNLASPAHKDLQTHRSAPELPATYRNLTPLDRPVTA